MVAMRLAILHHHLNRGGVSQVIANHLRSLATLAKEDRPERVAILYDGQRDGWPDDPLAGVGAFPVELVVLPALAYDEPGARADPDRLAEKLRTALEAAGFASEETLLHAHNHSLGKNASLPGALRLLADAGWRMLLQVHDFAEDNRPENYRHLREAIGESEPDRLGAILYPQGQGIHYATLTERDADILRDAGVVAERLHTLPNPVAEFDGMPSQEEARSRVFPALGLPAESRLIVYPVRGIRRKNLGEMLLLSALAPEGTCFAVTLRPKNPVEAASFDRWRRVAEDCKLPCRFDTGGPKEQGGYGCDFKDTLAAADAILTTSVAEGFGMVFLEAWLAGKPLIGRDLPEITREFKAAGMTFGGLYDSLPTSVHGSATDFGSLDPAEQISLITAAKPPAGVTVVGVSPDDPSEAKAQLIECLRCVDAGVEAEIERNAGVVRSTYSATRIGGLLSKVYDAAASRAEPGDEWVAASGLKVFKHFRAPAQMRMNPVRTETIAPPVFSLERRIAELSSVLLPKPTRETPVLPRLDRIRAVVFDVYGTLLISGSGDISLASEGSRGEAALGALRAVGFESTDGDAIVETLHDAIRAAHAASSSEHPEVEIRDIWRTMLGKMEIAANDVQIDRLAVEYECRVNPIWPMPGLVETLDALSGAEKTLGIVSNAQFFTPLAFEPLTGKPLADWGFEPDMCVWSYEHGEAKPGTYLYERTAEALAARGISPGEALFVGNDLRNDVWPAQQVGFKTPCCSPATLGRSAGGGTTLA